MVEETVKLVVFVPKIHDDKVRDAMGKARAGIVGDYKYCSFSIKGVGRYIPLEDAHPNIGRVGKLEEVALDVYPLVPNPHETTYNKYIRRG